MNDYRELRLDITPCDEAVTDVAAALLADIGYESFIPDDSGLTAYIPASAFSEADVADFISAFPLEGYNISWRENFIEGRDWNSEWEQNNFTPIVVKDRCVVHSSQHTDVPACEFDIVINPRLAFGTGHHATTSLIIAKLLEMHLEGKAVMDMGTGTGILAILAAMKGAVRVDAIEIDEMAFCNAKENTSLNHQNIGIIHGDARMLPMEPTYDVFIANINRNIVMADMEAYSASMKSGGTMLLSGFFESDVPMVETEALKYGLESKGYTTSDEWVCLELTRLSE